jgi:hypothetical protein
MKIDMKKWFWCLIVISLTSCIFESGPKEFCENGTIIHETKYEYDSLYRILTFKYSDKGSDWVLVNYLYKENGEVVTKEFFNSEQISEICSNSIWDSSGTIKFFLTCSPNSKIIGKSIFDSKGRVVDAYSYKEDSTLYLKYHNEYDDISGVGKFYWVDTTGKKMLSQEITYGSDGKTEEEIDYPIYSEDTTVSISKYVYSKGYFDNDIYIKDKLSFVNRIYTNDRGEPVASKSCAVNR